MIIAIVSSHVCSLLVTWSGCLLMCSTHLLSLPPSLC